MSQGLAIDIKLTESVRARVQALVDGLGDPVGFHEAIAKRVQNCVRDYLIAIAETRHDTANRLGAEPSGHWAQAAEKTSFTASSESATVSVNHPGIGRAAHDVTIVPGDGKEYLTLPMAAAAYNTRVSELAVAMTIFRIHREQNGKCDLLATKQNGVLVVLYALVKSVTQEQDRTLLPSDDEFGQAAKEGIADYVGYLMRRAA